LSRLVALIALFGSVASLGCAAVASCDTSVQKNPDKYVQGTVSGGVYMTSPYTGPFLSFGGGKSYDLIHNLGCVPQIIQIYVSFDEGGISNGGSMAPSAGNMSEVLEVDSEHIRIRNSTCTDLFVQVSASCGMAASVDAGADSSDSASD